MLDVKSAYPYAQIIENISKSTTRREVVRIMGVSDTERRQIGYNLTAGRVNAVEFCTTVHKVPQLKNIMEHLDIDKSDSDKAAAVFDIADAMKEYGVEIETINEEEVKASQDVVDLAIKKAMENGVEYAK